MKFVPDLQVFVVTSTNIWKSGSVTVPCPKHLSAGQRSALQVLDTFPSRSRFSPARKRATLGEFGFVPVGEDGRQAVGDLVRIRRRPLLEEAHHALAGVRAGAANLNATRINAVRLHRMV